MSIVIRKAVIVDAPYIANFQVLMAMETEDYVLDPAIVAKGAEAVFKNPNHGQYYVADDNGKIVACLLTTLEWSDWRNGTVLWIQSVYVVPEYRQAGVFTSLYNYVKAMVQNNPDLKGIRLYVDHRNQRAQKVYNAIGMNGEHYQLFEWMKE